MSDILEEVLKINSHLQNKVLLLAEAILPEKNFPAFRKLIIREFGEGGTKDQIKALFHNKSKRNGTSGTDRSNQFCKGGVKYE